MINWPTENWDDAKSIIDAWRKKKDRIIFTNGCFDLIHPGHLHLLSEAKKKGDRLIVGLNSDASVKRLKGFGRPVKDEKSRGALLGALKGVDLVVIFSEDTPFELINYLHPDVLVKGGDYAIENIVGAELVIASGGKVETIPFLKGYSSSKWIDKDSSIDG